MNRNVFFLFFISHLLLFSCQKTEFNNENDSLSSSRKEKFLELLDKMGYATSDATFSKTHVIVEKDLVFPLSYLESLVEKGFSPKSNEPYYWIGEDLNHSEQDTVVFRNRISTQSNVVGLADIYYIKYFLHSSVASDPNWVADIQQAALNWDAVTNCAIRFTRTSIESEADLTIYFDDGNAPVTNHNNLPSSVLGLAEPPLNGVPGSYIVLNDNGVPSGVPGDNEDTIEHEFGHTIGLQHQNASAFPTLPCTDNSVEESVMSTPRNFRALEITDNDVNASRIAWPFSYQAPSDIYIYSSNYSQSGIPGVTFYELEISLPNMEDVYGYEVLPTTGSDRRCLSFSLGKKSCGEITTVTFRGIPVDSGERYPCVYAARAVNYTGEYKGPLSTATETVWFSY